MNFSKTGVNFLHSLDAPYLVDVLLLPLEYLFSPINFAGQGSGREREREVSEGSGGEEGRSHYRGDATDPLPPSIDATQGRGGPPSESKGVSLLQLKLWPWLQITAQAAIKGR